jgi:hypothetical protein
VAAELNAEQLAGELESLVTPAVTFFPIRHHSPACAWHLERLLRAQPPDVILIEGPASFTPLIPLLLHAKTRAPFALYTTSPHPDEAPSSPRLEPETVPTSIRPPRLAAYYPFCDFSPELVALRVGSELGATLRFVDLEHGDQVRARRLEQDPAAPPRSESLHAEGRFRRSHFLQSLARRTGCRDHNDLWDHLFETRLGIATEGMEATWRFIRDVGAWCQLARIESTPEDLDADGTSARETAMAIAIRGELSRGTRRAVVVTGGFHAVALARLVSAPASPAQPAPTPGGGPSQSSLVRYSFEQLDALNGYASGMPSPYFYHQLWMHAQRNHGRELFAEAAAALLVDLGRLSRQSRTGNPASPADEIAALEQSRRLAVLRGHPGPTREDLLDGVRSCFVKGALDAEGTRVLELARRLLGGDGVGEVPPEAGVPPLVADFRDTANRFRLPTTDSVARRVALELHRKPRHRQASRFLHSLAFLEVPFGTRPDSPAPPGIPEPERMIEHWECRWTPQTESQLIEAGALGATIEEAAAARLQWSIRTLSQHGQARDAARAIDLLVQACRMGLHRQVASLVGWILEHLRQDPDLTSLARALDELLLLWTAREPLEAHRLPTIPRLIAEAYRRACRLLGQLATTPSQTAPATLDALITLRRTLQAWDPNDPQLDPDLFWDPLAQAVHQPSVPPLVRGGLTGLLHAEGHLAEPEAMQLLRGALMTVSVDTNEPTDFLLGLFQTCRDLVWRNPALVEAIDHMLAQWTEEEFLRRIPHLRLAFAELTPRETDHVAALVAAFHGASSAKLIPPRGICEDEAILAARINGKVRRSLIDDGLGSWLEEQARHGTQPNPPTP